MNTQKELVAMKRTLIVLLLCFALSTSLFGCSQETLPQNPPAAVAEDKPAEEAIQQETAPRRLIYIKGSDEFVTDITAALDMIAERTPEFYKDIRKYVTMIRYEKLGEDDFKTGGWANNIGWIYVTDYLYDRLKAAPSDFPIPEYELALLIVHETVYIRQAQEGRPGRGLEAEREALAVEREFLKALGVEPDLIEQASGEHWLDNPWWEEKPCGSEAFFFALPRLAFTTQAQKSVSRRRA